MSQAELEPGTPAKTPWRTQVRHKARRVSLRVRFAYRTFMETPKDARLTGAQAICFLAGLYFVSWWSIPVAGVIGAVLAIIALERQ